MRIPLVFIFALSLLVRLTVRDHISGLSTLYYATPLPVLSAIAFLIGLSWFERKSLKRSISFLLVAAGSLLVWGCANYHGDSHLDLPSNARLFFWNAARGSLGVQGMVTHAAQFSPNVIGIVEAGVEKKGTEATWRRGFPDHQICVLEGDMLFITTGESDCVETGELGPGGRYNVLITNLNGNTFTTILVDIDPNPFQSRRPAFAALTRVVDAHLQDNLIVMGDFNTPIESIYFDSFRRELIHSFEDSGSGLSATWPMPLPILTIDHLWVGRSIRLSKCRANWSHFSDHRSLTVDVDIGDLARETSSATGNNRLVRGRDE
ncbi:MAG TPA: endonuclease/exonuclease/phosphatase family protein [Blastocatellia bacterium]|nr:endonuclease/exonuclease/phosphatase family protein [Blastocatellia bacterium]